MKVIVEKQDTVTTVIINRPECRNAVDRETAELLSEAFVAFEKDETSDVAVLCGAERTFCAGYDLKTVSSGSIIHHPKDGGPMGPTRMLLSKPVIAAVEGHAVAGGLELALWCDMRVASTSAVFGVFCRRWGVPLIDGGTVRLPRLIGQSRALDMILTGRPIGAAEALAFGLANRVVIQGAARQEAEELALELSRFPQVCLRADRLSSYQQWNLDIPGALTQEAYGGEAPLLKEAAQGAARFSSGLGRSGDFGEI